MAQVSSNIYFCFMFICNFRFGDFNYFCQYLAYYKRKRGTESLFNIKFKCILGEPGTVSWSDTK